MQITKGFYESRFFNNTSRKLFIICICFTVFLFLISIGYKLNSTINNVKKVEKEFDTAKDKWTIANAYGFKENYIYVSISGKEDGKESTKFVRLKSDLSATDVLESESLVPTDLINNINLEK